MTRHTNDGSLPNEREKSDSDVTRALNDLLRKYQIGGTVMVTSGVIDLAPDAIQEIIRRVSEFDNFTEDDDPYGEHDFGIATYEGNRIFWKIDYYDNNLTDRPSNPENPKVKSRVMTVFLASDY